ncbi:valyl-tRNA synthetase [Methanothermus fervidus DSM 2088]|uniref:Valine--tRNA ligase n=1 Tax=Methanothermus fervidus (strain ATCC 43054 / DSM 2088 / JCM 10308 / V24 S) TaxID=523846 RepID=E3GXZ0_METFV|nr:valine--tRNA ligase [Methanothermus fervidus]ADP77172.1 valyl-tRNA synthetase [Methanothermus fervidus DSM 2088]
MRVEIPKDYDPKNESKWQKKWQKDKIYAFETDKRPSYVIDTPPPYPTGSIHMGHVLNWVYMDIIARFKRMNGFNVLFPQGWDCHGLPTEVKVEEIHNIKKGDVPREKFKKMCIDLTTENIKRMKRQMISLGFSQDWDREYITMDPEYIKKTQLSFLKMYKEGLIYRGVHPVNWCPRCETAIAFAEVEYSEKETYLNYIKFEGSESDIVIATTRPELLPACVAVLVHPDDERYTDMVGKKVKVPIFNQEVEILADEDVDPKFGTGAVMVCTFGDKTDVLWVKRHNLKIINAIDEKGRMTKAAKKYEGLSIEECRNKIIEDLDKKGFLIKKERIKQNVGRCWRCKTPVEILVKKQWFIDVNKLKKDVKKTINEIKWHPEHMKTRLLNWIDAMEWDWCISRQRIFGTPIPVWYCKECGKPHVATEDMLPVDPTKEKPNFTCECGCNEFIPERDVLDTWMDSSISPLVVAGWPQKNYRKLFPANLRPQGHDIIRTWAFYTILRCKALTGEKPFDEIVINGMVFGEDGHKMSKSRGNVIEPEEVLEKYGADALRLWAANSVPGSDVPFAWKDVKYGYKFLRKFWNAFRFMSIHIFKEEENEVEAKLNYMDRWILSKLNRLVENVTKSINQYNFADAITNIQQFVWHVFCDEYIEAVKYRLYSDENKEMREGAKRTLEKVLKTCLKLLAPFVPHFVEEVYQHFDDKSIHLTSWPTTNYELIDPEIEECGDTAVEIIRELRRFKSDKGIPLNAEIKQVKIYGDEETVEKIKPFFDDIKGTIRIQDLEIKAGKPSVKEKIIRIEPLMDRIGPKFRDKTSKVIKYLNSEDPEILIEKLKEGIEIDGKTITKDDIRVEKEIIGETGEKVEIVKPENVDVVLEIAVG